MSRMRRIVRISRSTSAASVFSLPIDSMIDAQRVERDHRHEVEREPRAGSRADERLLRHPAAPFFGLSWYARKNCRIMSTPRPS